MGTDNPRYLDQVIDCFLSKQAIDHKRQQMIKEGGNASQLTYHKNDHLHDHFLDFDFSPFFADLAAFFFAAIFIYIKKGNRI